MLARAGDPRACYRFLSPFTSVFMPFVSFVGVYLVVTGGPVPLNTLSLIFCGNLVGFFSPPLFFGVISVHLGPMVLYPLLHFSMLEMCINKYRR